MDRIRMDSPVEYSPPYPPVTEDLLTEIVHRILSVGGPLMIVLFGSRARGDNKPDSDIDLFVVEETSELATVRERQYSDALRGIYPELTLLARGLEHVEEWKYVRGYITTAALEHGQILYENKERLQSLHWGIGQSGLVTEEESEYKTPIDLARLWFRKAGRDIEAARVLLKNKHCFAEACFHAQQAAEKYLKGFLALHNLAPQKTHDLDSLVYQCQQLQPFPELTGIELKSMTKFAVSGRYDLYFEPEADQAEEALLKAERVKDTILSRVPPEACPA